ncbi:hypothetical protein AYI68_g6641, partial [Smittium mucronatum]
AQPAYGAQPAQPAYGAAAVVVGAPVGIIGGPPSAVGFPSLRSIIRPARGPAFYLPRKQRFLEYCFKNSDRCRINCIGRRNLGSCAKHYQNFRNWCRGKRVCRRQCGW